MSRYIFFKELKEKYTLVEIFEFLQAGLQPLRDHFRDHSLTPIPCPKEHHQYTLNNNAIKFVRDRFGHDSDTIAQFIKRNKEIEAEDPEHQSWKYFVPPDEESENIEVDFDNPSLNSLAKLSSQTREPENKELKDVVSILQKAIFERTNLKKVKKKIKSSQSEKQRRYDPFAKIMKRAIQIFVDTNTGQLPQSNDIRQLIIKDHNNESYSSEIDPKGFITSIKGAIFIIKHEGKKIQIDKWGFDKRFQRLIEKDFSINGR